MQPDSESIIRIIITKRLWHKGASDSVSFSVNHTHDGFSSPSVTSTQKICCADPQVWNSWVTFNDGCGSSVEFPYKLLVQRPPSCGRYVRPSLPGLVIVSLCHGSRISYVGGDEHRHVQRRQSELTDGGCDGIRSETFC